MTRSPDDNVRDGAPPKSPADLEDIRKQLETEIDGQPIICFANDWQGDPTSKHHVMKTLARYVDVLWVESSGMRRPKLSSASDLARIARKLRRSGGARKAAEHERLKVVSPLAVPLPGNSVVAALNRRIYSRAIQRALPDREGGNSLPLLWIYTPTVEPLLDAIPATGMVYHCVDRWWEFSEYDADVMREHHANLCRKADVVFASSAALLEDCRPFTGSVHLIRHGVEWEHFARAAVSPPPAPKPIRDLEGPIIGFFGLIHDWIDQNLIRDVAKALPEATVVLLGKSRVDTSTLEAVPNIRLLGQVPYVELPAYAARFAVGLVPFILNDLTEAVNPIKLREYLSAGVPVVSTALPELRPYAENPRVRIAAGRAEFVAAVRHFVAASEPPETRAEASRAMATESWAGRTAEMVRLWNETRR